MKKLSINEFKKSMDDIINGVVNGGDICHVKTKENNVFVIMNEPEYCQYRDALQCLIKCSAVLPDDMFEKLSEMLKSEERS